MPFCPSHVSFVRWRSLAIGCRVDKLWNRWKGIIDWTIDRSNSSLCNCSLDTLSEKEIKQIYSCTLLVALNDRLQDDVIDRQKFYALLYFAILLWSCWPCEEKAPFAARVLVEFPQLSPASAVPSLSMPHACRTHSWLMACPAAGRPAYLMTVWFQIVWRMPNR